MHTIGMVLLQTLIIKNNWTFNGGIDLKTYKGALYDIVTDMLGSDAFFVKEQLTHLMAILSIK